MATIVSASPYYGTVRIPDWIQEALHQWKQSPDFPKGVPMSIVDGELVVDLRPPGGQLPTYYTERQQLRNQPVRKKKGKPKA